MLRLTKWARAVAGESTTLLGTGSTAITYNVLQVFEAQEADLQTAKALSLDRMRGFVVRLRGLPYNASANEGGYMELNQRMDHMYWMPSID